MIFVGYVLTSFRSPLRISTISKKISVFLYQLRFPVTISVDIIIMQVIFLRQHFNLRICSNAVYFRVAAC